MPTPTLATTRSMPPERRSALAAGEARPCNSSHNHRGRRRGRRPQSRFVIWSIIGMKRNILLLLGRGILLAFFIAAPCGAAELEAPPPLGKLYEVGGHKMHLYATGESNRGPSVVLEAGAGAFSMDWYLVQQDVTKFARVSSYDRAGHAWSELGPRPRTYKQAAYD